MLGDRSRQLGTLFWRGGCPPSLHAALGALILTLLCKGFLCQLPGFTLTAPGSVSVQRGLCVLISCEFVYPASSYSNSYYSYDKTQGYWYKSPARPDRDPPVATNDGRQTVSAETRGRVRLVGDPGQGSCSLSIEDAREGDTGRYFFRIERGRLKYTFPSQLQVSVTELTEEPEMLIPPVLVPGKPIKATCRAPGTCSGTPPRITWTAEFSYTKSATLSQSYSNGSQAYSSIIDFTPFPEDQGKPLTCRVTYPAAQAAATQKTIRLHIDYPPKTVEINGTRMRNGLPVSVPWEVGSDSISIVTREGDSLSLVCETESSPSSSLNWTKGNKTLSSSSSILGQELRLELLNITTGDAGAYQCRAENPYGSANRTLRVHVQYRPRPGTVNSTCRQEGDGLHCTCSLRSQPRPQIQWQVEGETLAGNRSSGALQVISWAHGDEATSSLSWPGSQDGGRSILCVGSNPVGVHTLHFILSPSGTGASSVMVGTAALCGVVITASLFLLGLCLIRFWKHKKAPVKAVAGVEVQPAKGKEQTVDDASLIYSNIPPRSAPPAGEARAATNGKSTPLPLRPSRPSPAEPEKLHYASIEFSGLKTNAAPVPANTETEYSEIRWK